MSEASFTPVYVPDEPVVIGNRKHKDEPTLITHPQSSQHLPTVRFRVSRVDGLKRVEFEVINEFPRTTTGTVTFRFDHE